MQEGQNSKGYGLFIEGGQSGFLKLVFLKIIPETRFHQRQDNDKPMYLMQPHTLWDDLYLIDPHFDK